MLQGLSAALLSPAALATVMTLFTGADRGKALGVWSALAGAGSALGVILGGLLTSEAGWRWVFAINVPVAAATIAGAQTASQALARINARAVAVTGLALAAAGYAVAAH